MYSTFRLKADDLSCDLIKAIGTAYRHREIEIIVQEVQDETEYLLSTEANRQHLLRAMENFKKNENLHHGAGPHRRR